MSFLLVFWTFTIGALLFGWRAGNSIDRQIVALISTALALSTLAELMVGISGSFIWKAGIDSALLIAVGWLALRTDRYWPLWFAGLQLAAVLTSLSALLMSEENRWIFQTLGGFWAIPALVAMCIGLAKDRLAKISVAD